MARGLLSLSDRHSNAARPLASGGRFNAGLVDSMVDNKRLGRKHYAQTPLPDTQLPHSQLNREAMQQLIQAAKSHWQGCDWPTRFGPKNLNLAGIRSRQAKLAEKATRGDEATCWAAAVAWLTEVESDAVRAAEFAGQAFCEAEQNHWGVACDLLKHAELLEGKYGQLDGYQQVREAFQRWFASRALPT